MAKQKINYDLIFRYALDRHGNRCNDSLNFSYVQHLVADTMMSIIIRHGYLDELLTSLGLCSLCQGRRDKGRVIR